MYESTQPDPNLPPPPGAILPTMYELPSEHPEDPGLLDEFHGFQPQLLRETCQPSTCSADQVFIGSGINLYYDARQPQWYKRPDWFVVLRVPRVRMQQELRGSVTQVGRSLCQPTSRVNSELVTGFRCPGSVFCVVR